MDEHGGFFDDWHEHHDVPGFDDADHGGLDHGGLDHHDDGLDHWHPADLSIDHDAVTAADVPAEIDDAYPPHLDVPVEPADGRDWVDPQLLGADLDEPAPGEGPYAPPEQLLASLHGTADPGTEPTWSALAGSDDPAVRALAALWSPPDPRP